MEDEEIISQIQKGDKTLIGLIVDRYSQRLLNYLYRLTRDSDDAEDLLQEVFIRFYLNIESYDTTQPFKPWIYKIATNLCYDFFRKKKKVLSLDRSFTSKNNPAAPPLVETIAGTESQPEQELLDKELLEILQKAIESLPEKQKEAFILFHFEKFSYNEIAETLSIPMGTVKSRLYNAYQQVYFNVKKENPEWARIILIVLFMT
ncbi:MAG: sigma-70 family RNA polymerase sigma factor [bacterium]|nr:sigma-70 family RNA polymerase sigma factor [bacterium]